MCNVSVCQGISACCKQVLLLLKGKREAQALSTLVRSFLAYSANKKTTEAAQIHQSWEFWKYSPMFNKNLLRCWVLCLLQDWAQNSHPRRASFWGITLLYNKSYVVGVCFPPGMNLYPGATLVLTQGMTLQHKSFYLSIFNSTFTKWQVDARLTSLEITWQRFN